MRDERTARVRAPADPFVFAVGCPRSGTTLLQRILDAHPELTVANDTHFVPRCLKRYSTRAFEAARAGKPVPLSPELLQEVRSYRRTPRLGLDPERFERAERRTRTYAGFVAALYEELAAMRGKSFGGEKTPDYVRYLPLLHALFPRSRFVHIVRDGRDVALSVLQWANEAKGPGKLPSWRTDPVATTALWWASMVTGGCEAGAALGPDRYLEVRYDDLVAEPEATIRCVCCFLGLEFVPEMLAYHEGRRRDDPRLSAKKAWLPPTAGLRDWRSQMPAEDVGVFEVLAGDLLAALGWERSGRVPSAAAVVRAGTIRERGHAGAARR